MVSFDQLPKGYKECANGCGTAFRQFKTTDRFCSPKCYREATKEKRAKRQVKRDQYVERDAPERTTRAQQALERAKRATNEEEATSGPTRAPVRHQEHGSMFGWFEAADGRQFYMRSMWERNYARYLDWLIEKGEIKAWDYECKTFEFPGIRHGTTRYLPDFLITENDGRQWWMEVKGRITQKDRTKWKRMAKYHPDVELQILAKDDYYALAADLKKVIPGWETDR